MSSNEFMLKGKVIIKGIIELETGLHIGGLTETLKIGGTDTPVIKDAFDRIFIPGSSLKGKIRSLLEVAGYSKQEYKLGESGEPCGCGKCNVCKIFGAHKPKSEILEPRRVIVRDAYLVKEVKKDGKIEYEIVSGKEASKYLEVKPENVIDRISGKAEHPRQIERVVKGSLFSFEAIFNIYKEDDYKLIDIFLKGIKLLEDDYLGGCGSRGYGNIKFKTLEIVGRPITYYEGNDGEIEKDNVEEIVKEIINKWNEWKNKQN